MAIQVENLGELAAVLDAKAQSMNGPTDLRKIGEAVIMAISAVSILARTLDDFEKRNASG